MSREVKSREVNNVHDVNAFDEFGLSGLAKKLKLKRVQPMREQ